MLADKQIVWDKAEREREREREAERQGEKAQKDRDIGTK